MSGRRRVRSCAPSPHERGRDHAGPMLDSPCGDPSHDGTVARGARTLDRRPPFHVSHDGDGAAHRRGRVPSQPAGQGAVRRSGLRPRGLPGRHRVAAPARTGHLGPLLPRRRRRPHRRDDPVRDLPGVVRQGGGSLLGRSPDAEPLGLAPARDHQPLLPHRHAGPARRGHRLRRQVPRRGRRGGLLVRRGGDERRRLARGPDSPDSQQRRLVRPRKSADEGRRVSVSAVTNAIQAARRAATNPLARQPRQTADGAAPLLPTSS